MKMNVKSSNISSTDKQSDLINSVIKFLENAYADFLLVNRIIYKVKNQFRRQKQFKYLVKLKKVLDRSVFGNFVVTINNCQEGRTDKSTQVGLVLKSLKELGIFSRDQDILGDMLDLIVKLGCMIKEMLKLKLYIPYSLIVLGVLSRLHIIFNFIKENNEDIITAVDENIQALINIEKI